MPPSSQKWNEVGHFIPGVVRFLPHVDHAIHVGCIQPLHIMAEGQAERDEKHTLNHMVLVFNPFLLKLICDLN